MFLLLHITCSCIFMHTYLTFSIFLYILIVIGAFLHVSLSLLFMLVVSWHLNVNLLHPETLFVLGYHFLLLILLPLTSGSVMKRPIRTSLRTFLDEVFIRNTKLFCQISPTLTYPLSFTIGVRSHYVTSRSLVYPCLYRGSIPTCMDLIIQYLSLPLVLEVRTLWSL